MEFALSVPNSEFLHIRQMKTNSLVEFYIGLANYFHHGILRASKLRKFVLF